MGFLSRKKQNTSALTCLIIGEDKNVTHRTLDSTGAFLLDSKNLLAYDSFPQCMGSYTKVVKGKTKNLGLTSILFETMARPYDFFALDWVMVQHKEDQIKESALAEGCSRAVQNIDLGGRFDKMWTLALLAVGGVIGLALLLAFSSGLFSNIVGK